MPEDHLESKKRHCAIAKEANRGRKCKKSCKKKKATVPEDLLESKKRHCTGAKEENRQRKCKKSCKKKCNQLVSETSTPPLAHGPKHKSGSDLSFEVGTCLRPHPKKVDKGGEDACFIRDKVLGIFDGVGSWGSKQVDPGLCSKEFARLSNQHFQKDGMSPVRSLKSALSSNKEIGSTTATVAHLHSNRLCGLYIGDSGFIILREGVVIYETSESQQGFNYPCQLGRDQDGERIGSVSSGTEFSVKVRPGDIVIMASDGLWDNLFTKNIVKIANNVLAANSSVVQDMLAPKDLNEKRLRGQKSLIIQAERCHRMQLISELLAARAQEIGRDTEYKSPFSIKSEQAGMLFQGGKLDDVTIICAKVVKSSLMEM